MGKLIRKLFDWMFIYCRADLHVIDPKSDELVKLAKSKGLKCFKAADYTDSNDFVNVVNDLLKKYIDLIHKRQKKLFRKET